ncbi:pyruvate oxidase [Gracilibacillus oryzae]|uniref:Pyruvate oxidase n=1 Tax=Gracilibacillus oryzae TaxID=1672701 RepID=A0A7C8GQF2_9BACI|nr:pyruvate oxidase [Gracilibacillus oryzae]KAB8125893.1 pyruvate oxidase [Gracilibacillus oryzae]
MKASEEVVRILSDWDVNHIYGYPGDSVNNLIEEFRKSQSELKFIQVRHEEVATLAASAEAKLTGRVGVCVSIGGPGAIHLLNGMYDAKADSAPLVVITGQISHDLLGTDNFQEVNLERLFDDVAIFNKRVTSGKQLGPLLKQAFREAYEKKGVSVLTVPDDVFTEKVRKTELRSEAIPSFHLVPDKHSVQKAVSLIQQAKKPVILAGKGGMGARDELLEFAEKIAAPVVVSLRGKGVIPDQHPLCIGNLGHLGTKPAYKAMQNADLLMLIGTSYPYRDFLPSDAPAIQLDIDSSKIGKWYPVDAGLVGSAKEVLAGFNEQLTYKEDRDFLQECQQDMSDWWKQMDEIVSESSGNLQGPHVIGTLNDYLDDDAIVSIDVGNVTVWSARYLRLTNQKFIVSSWLATMGCGLPGAIAGKLNQPDKQVIAICGDGGFSMVMQDFLTAVKYRPPITVIILNNEEIAMIKYEQKEMGHSPYQTDIQDLNYADFAKASGANGYFVQNKDELVAALKECRNNDLPSIIDVKIESREPLPGK